MMKKCVHLSLYFNNICDVYIGRHCALRLSYDKLIAYRFAIKEVSNFATDLIACARTAEEVECVLKQTAGFGRSSTFAYPRLLLALDYEQKTFVAHPNVQQV